MCVHGHGCVREWWYACMGMHDVYAWMGVYVYECVGLFLLCVSI